MVKKYQGVRYVPRSGNAKIGGQDSNSLDAVYIAISQSCPSTCPFKPRDGVNRGCWATTGRAGILNSRLQKEAVGMDKRAIGREVAKAIDASWPRGVRPGQMMRLPVAGDLATTSSVKPVAAAVKRWKARGGRGAWGYTHAWRTVPRDAWGEVSVLASVETTSDARVAIKRGYAPAKVVAEFPNGDRAWDEGGTKFIPCPEQTRGITCDKCRLCFDDQRLLARRAVIAFRAHSLVKKRTLNVLQEVCR